MSGHKRRLRAYLWHRDGGRCQKCGEPLDLAAATVGHRRPKAFGGATNAANTQLECHSCNTIEGAAIGAALLRMEWE